MCSDWFEKDGAWYPEAQGASFWCAAHLCRVLGIFAVRPGVRSFAAREGTAREGASREGTARHGLAQEGIARSRRRARVKAAGRRGILPRLAQAIKAPWLQCGLFGGRISLGSAVSLGSA